MYEYALSPPPDDHLRIQRLSQLAAGRVQDSVDRALRAVPTMFAGETFDLERTAIGVYDKAYMPNDGRVETHAACTWSRPCIYDETGRHARSAVVNHLVDGYVGELAREPMPDHPAGTLSPEILRHILAHSVVYFGVSNWVIHQRRDTRPGDTCTYGGVMISLRAGDRGLGFVVATAGPAEPYHNEEVSYLVGHAIAADLVRAGHVKPLLPDSPSFIVRPSP